MPRSPILLVALIVALVVGCATPSTTPDPSSSAPALAAVPVVEGLDQPVDIAIRPGDATTYVLEQTGRIRLVRDGVLLEGSMLDISTEVLAGGERGLLGMAFAPDAADPRVFVYHTALSGNQVVASYRLDPANPDQTIADSRQEWLVMADQFGNHNGGALVFGPDGYLYVSTGDGGGGGDPLGSGQALDTLLGKILRIDVTPTADTDPPYTIPDDNPFVDEAGARGEIWLTGLRNPWRIRFDAPTGDLWIGDVGQGAWEEIDVAPAGASGRNYGWSVTEGFECFRGDGCDMDGLTPPVVAYRHDEGRSVVGGAVYRGSAIPDLVGWYVYADYYSGRVWAIDAAAGAAGEAVEPVLVVSTGRSLSSIALGPDGELYATDHGGALVRFEAAPA